MKVGIIRCNEHSESCAGYACFPAVQERTGAFESYDSVELIGFDTCGGCGRGRTDKIVVKAARLKKKGAEVIHLGNCLVGLCPFKDLYRDSIEEEIEIPVKFGTHPVKKK